jgi:heme/copper-type cytochrome/quinol oxidase subunit 3
MTGLRFREGLAKLHFWTMFIAFNSTFLPLFVVGARGMPRRVSTYSDAFRGINVWVSISAFCLGGSMLIFIANFVISQLLKREPAEPNPWDSRGLEWQLPTPIPPHDFDEIPQVLSSPYEYGVPDAPPVADLRPSHSGTATVVTTSSTGMHGFPIDDPDPTPSVLSVGTRMLSAAVVVFFGAFGFAYLYLKAQDSHGRWNHGDQVSVLFASVILAVLVVSAVAYGVAVHQLRDDDTGPWQPPATLCFVLGLLVVGLHVWQLDTLPFSPDDSGYASVFIGWTVALIAVEVGAMYWLLTLLRGALNIAGTSVDAYEVGPSPLTRHLVASARSYRLLWLVVVGVEIIAFVLLVLVR